jgi:general secretion pathway protein D
VIDDAERLSRTGDFEGAYAALDAALRRSPEDLALRTAQSRARDRVVVRALSLADLALAGGRGDEADRLLQRVRSLDPQNARLAGLQSDIERTRRVQQQVQARRAAARAAPADAPAPALSPAFQKSVSLEFRDAPLRQVFESLARSTGINFVFDKDVRGDNKVTVFLRGVSLDEAVRVVLSTQQLDRKLLNDNTLMVYPNTPAKQREHQELITRSLYLVNADVKQVLALVRTMTKTRDLHADERLNALVVRDTPEVVRQVERLIATVDLPDPEVMLAVEVMEVASDRLDELGISWPTEISYGVPGLTGAITAGSTLRGSVANPALVASLRGTTGSTNLLANPTIRARNREKAKVQIGEKLPLFTTTSATVNVGASTTVNLIDVGLKLDIEPTIQLDDEVTIKLSLEVSNLLRQVSGPNGSLAYQLGTRLTSTTLRLHDGQTQVLAGLINDEDRKSADGLPWLAELPLLGRLFGVRSDTRNKTEIVMLITPRIVRNLELPSLAQATQNSGTDASPGALSLRLKPQARIGVAPAGAARTTPEAPVEGLPEAANAAEAGLLLSATAEAAVGDTVSVTLANRSSASVRGELEYDATRLQPASASAVAGRVPFSAGPQQDAVTVFRVLPEAAGASVTVSITGLQANAPGGEAVTLRVEGDATVRVAALPPPGRK